MKKKKGRNCRKKRRYHAIIEESLVLAHKGAGLHRPEGDEQTLSCGKRWRGEEPHVLNWRIQKRRERGGGTLGCCWGGALYVKVNCKKKENYLKSAKNRYYHEESESLTTYAGEIYQGQWGPLWQSLCRKKHAKKAST